MFRKFGWVAVVGVLVTSFLAASALRSEAAEKKVLKGVVAVEADEEGEIVAVSVDGNALVLDAKSKALAEDCEGKTVEATVQVDDGKMTLVSYTVQEEEGGDVEDM